MRARIKHDPAENGRVIKPAKEIFYLIWTPAAHILFPA